MPRAGNLPPTDPPTATPLLCQWCGGSIDDDLIVRSVAPRQTDDVFVWKVAVEYSTEARDGEAMPQPLLCQWCGKLVDDELRLCKTGLDGQPRLRTCRTCRTAAYGDAAPETPRTPEEELARATVAASQARLAVSRWGRKE